MRSPLRAAALALSGMLLVAVPATALDISASVDAERVPLGARLTLTVEITGGGLDGKTPQLPDLSDAFAVYSAGTSRNFSIVNGRTSSSLSFRYVLQPKREGTFTIGPIKVEDRGTVASTRPIAITVTAAPQAPPPPDVTGGGEGGAVGDRDVFVRATVDKTSPFVFEQVVLRLTLYNRVRLADAPQLSGLSTQGFWKEEFPRSNPTTVAIDGETYQVWEASFALFPTAPGELTISDATMECQVLVRRQNRDPFSFFGGGLSDARPVVRTAAPITLSVKPLPAGAPPGFAGAVGDFVLDVGIDRTEVDQSAPATLTVTVSGNGNLRTIETLPEPKLADFRIYPQNDRQSMEPRGNVIAGTMSREYVLVPLSAGRKTVPPLEFVAFSPRAGEYRVLRSRPIELDVAAAAPGAPGGSVSGRDAIEVVGRDVRFIETAMPSFVRSSGSGTAALRWLWLLSVPAFGYAGVAVWAARRRRLDSDQAYRRRTSAAKDARRALKQAEGVSDGAERAELAAAALRGYVADRRNRSRAGITDDDVAACIREAGLAAEPALAFLARCDAVRYAPGLAGNAGFQPVEECRTWIDRLESAS